ncbi:DNA-binding protein [Massilia niastensis]|uniref:DNA-binding protein n=1 Tax=Massilia niastensis TaxID=544911 RepID=UPI000371D3FC|nr:DNA-binding protein [Massilia niastensis]
MNHAEHHTIPSPLETDSASAGVSFDEVAAAAASLRDEGARVTIEAVRELLGAGSPGAIHQHLAAWRAGQAAAPQLDIPESLIAALNSWVQQVAQETSAPVREALADSESDMEALLASGERLETERHQAAKAVAERSAEIERLTIELRDARQIATEALVGKAKDQLAIEGKDRQLTDLRAQLERNVAASAAESDARLAAEMELVGAVTARNEFAHEIESLRTQLEALRGARPA